jgi:hypothetical protein
MLGHQGKGAGALSHCCKEIRGMREKYRIERRLCARCVQGRDQRAVAVVYHRWRGRGRDVDLPGHGWLGHGALEGIERCSTYKRSGLRFDAT